MSMQLRPRFQSRADIPALLREMTLEEKARLVTGRSSFTTHGVERLGIPSCVVLDGGTGVNFYQLLGDIYSRAQRAGADGPDVSGMRSYAAMMRILDNIKTPENLSAEDREKYDVVMGELRKIVPSGDLPGCFPPGMMLGATWEPQVVYDCGNAVGKEMDVFHIDMVLGSPNVNIHRDPLNGRVFEGYSEDPCLTAKLSPEFVKGVQAEGLIANVKHYAANNQETNRQNVDEIIPLRALYEIYFPGFKACVEGGGVKSVMSAYNKINGISCAMNPWLLNDVLRGEWGFDGLVVSDWGAAYVQAEAIAAGNDLDMPGPRDVQPIIDAVYSGALKLEELDLAVTRMLEMLLEMPVTKEGRKNTAIDREYSRRAAYNAAAEGIVLLKNDGLLPLGRDARVSFVGERSKLFVESGGGSAYVVTDQSTSVYETTREKLGADRVTFGAVEGDVVVISVAAQGQEGSDRPAMDLEPEDKALLLESVREAKGKGMKTVVILNIAGPVDMTEYIDDADAVLCVFFPGMEGGRAAAEILLGETNPSGKLPLTFPKRYKDCPTYGNFPGSAAEVVYGEGILVGYRYYDYKDVEPLFPFGHGLSYSTFALSDLAISADTLDMDADETVTVSLRIRNTSAVAGKEVVQLYIGDAVSTLVKPVKELKDFRKVFLQAGEEKEISFVIGKGQLSSYDPQHGQWIAEAGRYDVYVGCSSRDIRLTGSFTARGKTPYNYNPQTMLDTVFRDPRAVAVVERYLALCGMNMDALEDALVFFPHKPCVTVMLPIFKLAKGDAQAQRMCDDFFRELGEIDLSIA